MTSLVQGSGVKYQTKKVTIKIIIGTQTELKNLFNLSFFLPMMKINMKISENI